MTIGEIALMINEEGWLNNGLKVDLNIVKMQGWNRTMYFEDTNLDFIPPSPNIPDIDTAILYYNMYLDQYVGGNYYMNIKDRILEMKNMTKNNLFIIHRRFLVCLECSSMNLLLVSIILS